MRRLDKDVFDAEGRYTARVVLPAWVRAIKAGKLYSIEENADANPLAKRYALNRK